jgi:Trk K+ transport system NAD-binding subunit
MVEVQLQHKDSRYRVKMSAGHNFEEVRSSARAAKIFGLNAGNLSKLIEESRKEGSLAEIDFVVSPVMSRNLAIFGNRMKKGADGRVELNGERGSIARGKFELSCETAAEALEKLRGLESSQIAIVEVRKVLTGNGVTVLDVDPNEIKIQDVSEIDGRKITAHYDSEHELRIVRIGEIDYVFDARSREVIVPIMLDPTLAKRISVAVETQMLGDIRAGDHAKTSFRLIGTDYEKLGSKPKVIEGC